MDYGIFRCIRFLDESTSVKFEDIEIKFYGDSITEDERDKALNKYSRVIKSHISSNYSKIKKLANGEYNDYFDDMTKSEINSIIEKFAKKPDTITITIRNNKIVIEMIYNNYYSSKDSGLFFGGHSLWNTIVIEKDKIVEDEITLEG